MGGGGGGGGSAWTITLHTLCHDDGMERKEKKLLLFSSVCNWLQFLKLIFWALFHKINGEDKWETIGY